MKILCVHQGAELYGSDRSFALSIKTLRDKYPAAEITVVLPCTGDLVPLLEPYIDHLQIADVGTMQRSDFRNPLSIAKKIFSSAYKAWKNIRKYDVVYMNTIVVFSYMIASVFTNKLTINHVREIPGKKEGLIFSLLFRLNRSHLIFNSKYTQDSFSFLSKERSYVVLNGVLGPTEIPIQASESTFNILLIGRINAWKGQILALEAIKSLAKKYPVIRLRIVGGTAERQEFYITDLIDSIKEHNLESIVKHYPFQSDPTEHFRWSNISLVPSTKPEPFGRVAIESLAFGRPVIASNHGGLIEIIDGDVGGYLFKNNDAIDLALKISALIDDKNLMSEKSKEASKCFNSRFSEDVYVEKFSTTFDRVLQKG